MPEPIVLDFVTMTATRRERIETNRTSFADGYPSNPSTRADTQAVQLTVQLDIHGPNAADNTQIVTTLFRSDYGVQALAASGFDVAPLFTSEPQQIPFVNGEQQIETRWSFDAVMQANPIVTSRQDFAAALGVGVISVDATYPP